MLEAAGRAGRGVKGSWQVGSGGSERERGEVGPDVIHCAGKLLSGKRFGGGKEMGCTAGLGWACWAGLALLTFFVLFLFSFSNSNILF